MGSQHIRGLVVRYVALDLFALCPGPFTVFLEPRFDPLRLFRKLLDLIFPSWAVIRVGRFIAFLAVFLGTILKRKEPHIYVANWFYLSFIVTIAMLHVVNNLAIPVSFLGSASVQVTGGVQDAMVQWWYGHNAVGFFLTAGFLAIMYYFMPKRANMPIYSFTWVKMQKRTTRNPCLPFNGYLARVGALKIRTRPTGLKTIPLPELVMAGADTSARPSTCRMNMNRETNDVMKRLCRTAIIIPN